MTRQTTLSPNNRPLSQHLPIPFTCSGFMYFVRRALKRGTSCCVYQVGRWLCSSPEMRLDAELGVPGVLIDVLPHIWYHCASVRQRLWRNRCGRESGASTQRPSPYYGGRRNCGSVSTGRLRPSRHTSHKPDAPSASRAVESSEALYRYGIAAL
jgi:hypothetical protein